jgi:hypothetical protein
MAFVGVSTVVPVVSEDVAQDRYLLRVKPRVLAQPELPLMAALTAGRTICPTTGSTMGLSKTTPMPTTTPVTGLAFKRSSIKATSISPRRDDNHAPATAIFSEAQTTPRRR